MMTSRVGQGEIENCLLPRSYLIPLILDGVWAAADGDVSAQGCRDRAGRALKNDGVRQHNAHAGAASGDLLARSDGDLAPQRGEVLALRDVRQLVRQQPPALAARWV